MKKLLMIAVAAATLGLAGFASSSAFAWGNGGYYGGYHGGYYTHSYSYDYNGDGC